MIDLAVRRLRAPGSRLQGLQVLRGVVPPCALRTWGHAASMARGIASRLAQSGGISSQINTVNIARPHCTLAALESGAWSLEPEAPSPKPALDDERGAIMVMGVVMAVFLVAMVYYVVGIGEAVLYRERLQDASDAASLSASLLHARGMNFIVLINLMMAALVAILLILNVLLTLIRIAIIALTLASFLSFGSTAGLAALLSGLHQSVQSAYTVVEPVVMNTLSVLHQVQRAVKVAVPPVAILDTMVEVNAHHQGPAKFAFAVPTRLTLPVEPDRYSVLCERAAAEVADFATQPLPGGARRLIGNAATGLASQASAWLCGAGNASPPTYRQEQRLSYPTLPGYESCQQDPIASLGSSSETERCERLRAEQQHAIPDERGDCQLGEDCSLDGPYEQVIARAREQCKPEPGRALRGYRWQQKTIAAEFEWTGEQWLRLESDEGPGRIVPSGEDGSTLPPCGTWPGAIGEDWNERVHPIGDPDEVLPVCTEDYEDTLPLAIGLSPGTRHTVEYQAVTQILGCTEQKTFRVPIGAENAASLGSSGSGREPHRVEADLDLGSEAFQLRALAVGEGLTSVPERVMKIAAYRRCDDGNCAGLADIARNLSRFSVAQAEYFYDHDGSEARAEWMWTMKWRARLVRVRPFEEESREPRRAEAPAPDATDTCRNIPGADDCSQAASSFATLAEGALH